jgi:hypothetical protein
LFDILNHCVEYFKTLRHPAGEPFEGFFCSLAPDFKTGFIAMLSGFAIHGQGDAQGRGCVFMGNESLAGNK